jgi:hypothetical protein
MSPMHAPASVLALVGVAAPAFAGPSMTGGDFQSRETIKLFVFAGQSNMVGGNSLDALATIDPARLEATPEVRHTYRLNQTSDPDGWGALAHHNGVIGGTTWGPDLVFGQDHNALGMEHKTAMIKTARSGTSLAKDWVPSADFLFQDSVSYIDRQMRELRRQGYRVEVEGIFWVQGFADTGFPDDAAAYGDNLTILSEAFRDHFNDAELPFFFTRQHIDSQRQQYLDVMRAGQEAFAAGDANAYMIDIDDIGFRDEFIHYDAAGTIAIGQRLLDAYLASEGLLTVPTPGATAVLAGAGVVAFRRRR